MSEEQNTESTDAAQEAQAQEPQAAQQRKPRRARRATAPVTAPAPVEQEEPAISAGGAPAPVETEPVAATEPAPVETPVKEAAASARPARRRRTTSPRRATSATVAEADAARREDAEEGTAQEEQRHQVEEETTEPAGSDATSSARAPKRSRRSTQKTELAEASPTLDVFAAFGVQPGTEEEPEEPADEVQIDIDLPDRDSTDPDGHAEDEEDSDEDETAEEDSSPRLPATALLFQAPEIAGSRRRPPTAEPDSETAESLAEQDADHVEDEASSGVSSDDSGQSGGGKRRRRRGGRGRRKGSGGSSNADTGTESGRSEEKPGTDDSSSSESGSNDADDGKKSSTPGESGPDNAGGTDNNGNNNGNGNGSGESGGSSRRRRRRRGGRSRGDNGGSGDEVTALKGSTRLEAKRQRRKEGRNATRRRSIITEAEFLARRESVERKMVVRSMEGRTQIAVLEDDVLVEHYVARKSQTSMVGNVYLGRVQNVLPSMEAAFVDIGRGRNAVLYAGEVNWDAAGLEGQPRRIEQALKSGDFVLVQVTKDPIGTKGARLTAQVTLAGRFLVLVPNGSMTGISRKLPESERNRLKKLLKDLVPEDQGVIVRTAAEGASEEQLKRDIDRLTSQWAEIEKKQAKGASSPVLLKGEPELATRVVRDIFNEDFSELVISGETAWKTLSEYVNSVASDLADRLTKWTNKQDVFAAHRIDEQLTKGTDRKVYLPSGGSLVIDRTEAMTVVDVNTGKYTGSGGTLEETVTKNNLEAAEEIVRQLRLRDIGGIIVIDFIDMVLESNRELVLRRLVECLGRDRTRHQVAEVTSLGLVQMTRKRVGQGLVEAFSTPCECCNGRGFIVHNDPVGEKKDAPAKETVKKDAPEEEPEDDPQREQLKATLQAIAAAASSAHEEGETGEQEADETAEKADPA
ncbi:Rne/Rng family ribonuclease [Ruania albidiflava]|uniref:Rne/Rng family ribonuclease n=1 Tax=Ruania albidiflava TaxID=366586 RepID=UPI0023F4AB98|nr:Rne/Rng family ribonuclease [Ruania albidiflava]